MKVVQPTGRFEDLTEGNLQHTNVQMKLCLLSSGHFKLLVSYPSPDPETDAATSIHRVNPQRHFTIEFYPDGKPLPAVVVGQELLGDGTPEGYPEIAD